MCYNKGEICGEKYRIFRMHRMKYMRIRNQSLAKKILISGKKVCKMYCGKCGRPLGKGGVCFYCGNRMTTRPLQAQSRNVFPVLCLIIIVLNTIGVFVCYFLFTSDVISDALVTATQNDDNLTTAEKSEEIEATILFFKMMNECLPSIIWIVLRTIAFVGVGIILLRRKNLRWSVLLLGITAVIGTLYVFVAEQRICDEFKASLAELFESIDDSVGYNGVIGGFLNGIGAGDTMNEEIQEYQRMRAMLDLLYDVLRVLYILAIRYSLAPIALLSATILFVREQKVFTALIITASILTLLFYFLVGAVNTCISPLFVLFMGLSLRKDYQILEMERKR